MSNALTLIYLLLLVFFSQQTLAEKTYTSKGNIKSELNDLSFEVRKQIQERIDLGYHLGTVVGIVDKDGLRFYSFGQMSLTDKNIPDENTIFEIGSITKVFTSALIADLEIHNKINIEASIGNYLPEFKTLLLSNNTTISIEDLINHTSGLPRDPTLLSDHDGNTRYSDFTVENLMKELTLPEFTLGPKEYSYSNIAYLYLEHAIEKIMNTSYESAIKTKILKPLGMSDTSFVVPDNKRNRLATGFANGKHTSELDLGLFQSPGGLRTTSKDMLKYLQAQVGLIQSPLSNAMKVTHKKRFSNDEIELGLAWDILERKESGKTILYHRGATNGYTNYVGINVEDKVGVVILMNGRRWYSDLGFNILDKTYPLKTNLEPNL
jgi:CubicO group peptidase (beta-lactamase class C family)